MGPAGMPGMMPMQMMGQMVIVRPVIVSGGSFFF